MNKKNFFVIVVDALSFKSVERRVGANWVMPYLRDMLEKGNSWNKVYSLAPYTEAALVSLLGNKATLDEGGYYFGNASCNASLLQKFKDAGYRTFLNFSPYVYSKAYLKGVDEFSYTRLYSIQPLLMYRLSSYKETLDNGTITQEQLRACVVLVNEAFETWLQQLKASLERSPSAKLIEVFQNVPNLNLVNDRLEQFYNEFKEDPYGFTKSLITLQDIHPLVILNKLYNEKENFPCSKWIMENLQAALQRMQYRFSSTKIKSKLYIKYFINLLKDPNEGVFSSLGLLKRCVKIPREKQLLNYLSGITCKTKVETSLNRQFAYAYEWAIQQAKKEKPFIAILHAQDFHLPSVFHTYDMDSAELISKDFSIAETFLDGIDEDYTGNIVADLSAHYVDSVLEKWVTRIKNSFEEDCLIVITADHGFPLYNDPPRPYIYNQTFTEAFHVPFIIPGYDNDALIPYDKDEIVSSLSLMNALTCRSLNQPYKSESNGYVIAEYAGPGCPEIANKEIWYTYIDENWRISARCMPEEDFQIKHVVSVYDLENDPHEYKNIVGQLRYKCFIPQIDEAVQRLAARHSYLKAQVFEFGFWNKVMSANSIKKDLLMIEENKKV